MEGIRINKYLSEAGICSRRQADRMLEQGRIAINGLPASVGQRILPGDQVSVDGRPVHHQVQPVILAFNKPQGIVCTTARTENGEAVRNVVDYIHYPIRVYPVGRLDQASTGLILLTNQGELMDQILRSRNNHEKEYFVRVTKKITPEFICDMQKGVPILDTVTKPCRIWKEDDYSFHIILTQGLNRQIRRMCEYFGYRVSYLRRDRIMNITLEGIPAGRYRELTEAEISELKKMLAHPETEKMQPIQRADSAQKKPATTTMQASRRKQSQGKNPSAGNTMKSKGRNHES